MTMLIPLLHQIVRFRYKLLGLRSRFVSMNGCMVHYVESPHNSHQSTLFLVHGLGTSSSSWTKILPSLVSRHRVVALDLPGFGLSTLPSGKGFLLLEEFDGILHDFAEKVLPHRFTLVGHSLGGWLAMRFAVKHPHNTEKLILMNTAGIFYPGVESQAESFSLHSLDDLKTLLNAMWYRYPWYFKPFAKSILKDLLRRNVSSLVQTIKEGEFMNSALSQLTMPVHVVWGDEDRLISAECVRIITQTLPDTTVEHIERCGHVPQLEKPKELKHILLKILDGH